MLMFIHSKFKHDFNIFAIKELVRCGILKWQAEEREEVQKLNIDIIMAIHSISLNCFHIIR